MKLKQGSLCFIGVSTEIMGRSYNNSGKKTIENFVHNIQSQKIFK